MFLRTFSIGVACGMTCLFANVVLISGATHAAHPISTGHGLQERRPLFRPPSRGSSSTSPATRWRPRARIPNLHTPTSPPERPFMLVPGGGSPFDQAPNREPQAVRDASATSPPSNPDYRFRPTDRAARYQPPGPQVSVRRRAQRPPPLTFGSPQFRPAQPRSVKVYEQLSAVDPAQGPRAVNAMPRYGLPPMELPLRHRSYWLDW